MFFWGASKMKKFVFAFLLVLQSAAFAEPTPVETLFNAVEKGDIPKLRELKKNFTTGELKNEKGDSLLQVAVKHKQKDVVVYLVFHGFVSSINSTDSQGYTPLTRSIANKTPDIAEILLKEIPGQEKQLKADPNLMDANKNYPVALAVEKMQKETLGHMVYAAEVNADVRDPEGFTPLTRAVSYQRVDLVSLLVQSTKIDLKFTDSKGKTAYDYAKVVNNRLILAYVNPTPSDETSRDVAPQMAPMAPAMSAPPAAKSARANEEDFVTVKIPYGTNRDKTGMEDANYFYGEELSELQYGEATVTIPKTHIKGKVERPGFFSWGKENPKEHIILKSVETFTNNAGFNERLKARRAESVLNAPGKVDADDVFLFIHGFNTVFPYALRKVGQLYIDLEFKGVPIAYSWPSRDLTVPMPWDFKLDTAMIDASIPAMRAFIKNLQAQLDRNSDQCIHLVAHSLGNRALQSILAKISDQEAPERLRLGANYKPPFCEVIMAAPAVDAEVYLKDFARRLDLVSDRVTIIASDDDKALATQWLAEEDDFSYPLGTRSAEKLFAVSPYAHFLDASKVKGGMFDLGHAKYSDIPEIINDIRRVIVGREPTKERGTLLSKFLDFWFFDDDDVRKQSNLEYWEMKPVR